LNAKAAMGGCSGNSSKPRSAQGAAASRSVSPIAFCVVEITEREACEQLVRLGIRGIRGRFGGLAGSWLGSKIVQQGAPGGSAAWRAIVF